MLRKEAQKESESTGQFVTRLRQLAILYEFGDQVDDFIRDQVIDNCRSKCLRTKLLAERDLKLDRALDLAAAMEASERQAAQISQDGERVNAVVGRDREHKWKQKGPKQHRPSESQSQDSLDNKPTCGRCGRGHAGAVCQRTKGQKCFKCG